MNGDKARKQRKDDQTMRPWVVNYPAESNVSAISDGIVASIANVGGR